MIGDPTRDNNSVRHIQSLAADRNPIKGLSACYSCQKQCLQGSGWRGGGFIDHFSCFFRPSIPLRLHMSIRKGSKIAVVKTMNYSCFWGT
uniref:Apple domain-containing protein n=1 Tax=Steinernema glaseri TaxID=37863 RepID=A0A1I7Z638_9BILA